MKCLSLALVLIAFSQGVLAQSVHYRDVPAQDPDAAAEAGVLSYDLTRHGAVNAIKLYGTAGMLAECEVLLDEVQQATCKVPDRGDFRLRFKPDEWADFEDLGSGENVRYVFEKIEEGDPRATAPDTETRLSGHGVSIEVEGSLTHEEAKERWGDVGPLLRHAVAEVLLAIEQEERSLAPQPGKSQTPGGQNIDLCRDGEETCSRTIGGYAAQALGLSRSGCCRVASGRAGDLCYQRTGRGCCANSLCSALDLFVGWSCGLDGFPWTCEPRCEGYLTHPASPIHPQ